MPSGAPVAVRHGVSRMAWVIATPLRTLLVGLVLAYRHTISPLLGPTCRYYPSCSAYGLAALRAHGVAKGVLLTSWRLLRCNPWSRGGLDPVPAPGCWHPEILPDGTPRPAPSHLT